MSADNILVAMLGGAANERLGALQRQEEFGLQKKLMEEQERIRASAREQQLRGTRALELAEQSQAEQRAAIVAENLYNRLGELAERSPEARVLQEDFISYVQSGVPISEVLELPRFKRVQEQLAEVSAGRINYGTGRPLEEAAENAQADVAGGLAARGMEDAELLDQLDATAATVQGSNLPPVARNAILNDIQEAREDSPAAVRALLNSPDMVALLNATAESATLNAESALDLPRRRGVEEGTEQAAVRNTVFGLTGMDPMGARGQVTYFDKNTMQLRQLPASSALAAEMSNSPDRYVPEADLRYSEDSSGNPILRLGSFGPVYRQDRETGNLSLMSPGRQVQPPQQGQSFVSDPEQEALSGAGLTPPPPPRLPGNALPMQEAQKARELLKGNSSVGFEGPARTLNQLGYTSAILRDIPDYDLVESSSGYAESMTRNLSGMIVVGDIAAEAMNALSGDETLGDRATKAARYFENLQHRIRQINIVNRNQAGVIDQQNAVRALGVNYGLFTRPDRLDSNLESSQALLTDSIRTLNLIIDDPSTNVRELAEYRRAREEQIEVLSMIEPVLLSREIHTTRVPIPTEAGRTININIGELERQDYDQLTDYINSYYRRERALPRGYDLRILNLLDAYGFSKGWTTEGNEQ